MCKKNMGHEPSSPLRGCVEGCSHYCRNELVEIRTAVEVEVALIEKVWSIQDSLELTNLGTTHLDKRLAGDLTAFLSLCTRIDRAWKTSVASGH